jgi:hypothetical protein
MTEFFSGAATAASWIAGLFFLRFWRETAERLFLLFALAFFVLGLNWLLVTAIHPAGETRPYFYLVRLVAFVLIIVAIVDKNRRAGPGS